MSGIENFNDYPKHPGQTTPRPYYVEIPLETFETMSEEFAELRKHELAWDLDKARIKELEAENESHKYSVATLDTDIAMMKRWRKCSDEMPSADEGYFIVLWEDNFPDIGYIGAEDEVIETIRDRGEGHSVEWWMPLPKAPKETR